MNFSPYQFRAGTGYLPNPNQPTPLCTSYPTFTSSPALQPGYAHHLYYPSTGQIAAIPPPPPAQPKKTNKDVLPPAKPASTVAAPSCTSTSKTLVTDSKCSCTTTFNPRNNTYTTVCTCTTEDPKPAPEKKKVEKKKEDMSSSIPPPTLRPGENYMFPGEHTMLHVFNKAAPVWEDKYHGQGLAFKMFKVATSFTVGNVIERVMKKKGEGCEGWSVTEVVEMGEGCWVKGSSVKYGSDKAKGTLGAMGWGGKRGGTLPPVWMVVCKD